MYNTTILEFKGLPGNILKVTWQEVLITQVPKRYDRHSNKSKTG